MARLNGMPGFAEPRAGRAWSRRYGATLELLATVTLTVSLIVAATAVSLGNKTLTHGQSNETPAAKAAMSPVQHP